MAKSGMAPFDLIGYLNRKFPSLSFRGAVFYECPPGIRFEIGLDAIPERPVALYEAAFQPADTCVLISQDWPMIGFSDEVQSRYPTLVSMPNTFEADREPKTEHCEVRIDGEEEGADRYTLRWAQLPARNFNYASVFQAIGASDLLQEIANSHTGDVDSSAEETIYLTDEELAHGWLVRKTDTEERTGPTTRSKVYFLNPVTEILLHMYDDRGLDIVSTHKEPLLPLYRTFSDWVLDWDREQIVASLRV